MTNLIFVDGSFLLHRSMHHPVYKKFSTPSGVPTGGVFGFFQTIMKLHKQYGPNICVAWEGGGASKKRANLYTGYKANRDHRETTEWKVEEGQIILASPDLNSFSFQQSVVNLILHHLNIPSRFAPGFEADDLLATWAASSIGSYRDVRSFIYTVDRDLFQCVTDRVSVICSKPGKSEDELIDNEKIRSSHGCGFGIVLEKMLRGDASDNFGGAEFCWPSANNTPKIAMMPPRMVAAILKNDFPTEFEAILQYLKHPSDSSPLLNFPAFEVTEDSEQQLRRNYELALLQTDISDVWEVQPTAEILAWFPTLNSIFSTLAMKKWASKLDDWLTLRDSARHPFTR